MKIDLEGTDLQHRDFLEIRAERSERDWMVARKTETTFEAFGGPANLNEMIEAFLAWAEDSRPIVLETQS
jgi:hypothetical protein